MASELCMAISVTRQVPELIVPAKPTPHEIKQLSDIDDQEGLRLQIPLIFFYKNEPSMKGRDPVKVIKRAISNALVFYYPLAGRLKELGSNRKLVVDCTSEGVLFIEADANVTLEELGEAILPPCPYLDQLLYNVPGSDAILGCPLLLIQVTRLACGGFVLALRLNHTMCDADGLGQFLKTMEEMARDAHATPSVLPVWRRELLHSRNPPRITCTHHEYQETHNARDNPFTEVNQITKSFYFGPNEIQALRTHLPLHLRNNCTTFELLTACIWKCRVVAFDMDREEIVRLACLVNFRGKRYNMNLPSGYYGNAFVFPAEYTKVDLLCKNSLGYVVELVKKVKARTNEEYVRSVADFMVIKGRPMYVTKGSFIVSDNTRARFREVDFGWGKPIFAGVTLATSIISFLIKHENRSGEHGILVPISLPVPTMEKFHKELKKMIQGPNVKQD